MSDVPQPTQSVPRGVAARAGGGARRARRGRGREAVITSGLGFCGLFSLATTLAILIVLFTEAARFFARPEITFREFFLTGEWAPLLGAEKHFGIWPLIAGTLLVTAVACVVAVPFGLVTALYLSEYAPKRVRAVLKPVLEILAGIPTVVYGYFALIAITPFYQWVQNTLVTSGANLVLTPGSLLHEWITKPINAYNAMGAGTAVGVMCLPLVCSLSEDALQAVPRSLREGAYAVGATRFDVSVKVVIPAALSGVIASFLLAVARAVGETMIVALAAGGLARLTADPRDDVQTMTGYMAQTFLGDAPAFGVEYQSCYAVGAMLFLMTLVLTLLGHRVMMRYREVYQ